MYILYADFISVKVRPSTKECSVYDAIPSKCRVSVLELWGIWNTFSLYWNGSLRVNLDKDHNFNYFVYTCESVIVLYNYMLLYKSIDFWIEWI